MVKLKENEVLVYREVIIKKNDGHIRLPFENFFTPYNYCCKSLIFKDAKPFLDRLFSRDIYSLSNKIESVLIETGDLLKKDLVLVSHPDYKLKFDVSGSYSDVYVHHARGVGYRKLRKFAEMMQFPEFYLLSDKRLR